MVCVYLKYPVKLKGIIDSSLYKHLLSLAPQLVPPVHVLHHHGGQAGVLSVSHEHHLVTPGGPGQVDHLGLRYIYGFKLKIINYQHIHYILSTTL